MPTIELLIAGFLGVIFIALFLSIRAKLPYTVVLVFAGIFLAIVSNSSLFGISVLGSVAKQMSALAQELTSGQNGGIFVGLIVPPILFEATMHISSKDLKAVFKPAIVLATVGVVVATLVGGIVLWLVAGLPIFVSFLFAAVISPTDTATVLEIFRKVPVPKKLAVLLDTEASFNDATGIVIFTVVLATASITTTFNFTDTVTNFALIFGGGLAVGFGVAFVAELLTSSLSDPISSIILTVSAVYGSYALASSFGFSGLVAVAVVGLYFGNLTMRSAMGANTREFVRLFWVIAAFFGNTIAFLFIGLRVSSFEITASTVILVVLAYLAVTVSRAVSAYPILGFFDRFGSLKIPMQWRNVAMLGGVRGAVSIALAASIVVSSTITKDEVNTVNALVFGVALISITGQAFVLSRYASRAFHQDRESVHEKLNIRLAKALTAIEALQKMSEDNKISESEYAEQLEKEKDDLTEILSEINSKVDTASIAKARALEIYSSLRSLRNGNVVKILRHSSSSSESTSSSSVEKIMEGTVNKLEEEEEPESK